MLRRIDLRGMKGPLASQLPRFDLDADVPVSAVREIISEVRNGGDQAIRSLTSQFDRVDVTDPLVGKDALSDAWHSLDSRLSDA
ncbi:MAG: histidinol dehydrogenase, partial [Actinomycetota bacterium]|nr:histidinol dehydrogenase [Actinomycetota bacterium]